MKTLVILLLSIFILNNILNPSVSTENIYSYQPNPFTLYPVPASDFIIIDSDLDNISITGVGGTTLLNIKNYKKGDFINLKGLSNGVYFLASTLNGQSLKARSFIVSR